MSSDNAADVGAKRSLRTILAGDVVGYSRHMGEAEEATLAALARHRTLIDGLIDHHRGRIFITAGDSVLAAFETPTDAVRCALAVQDGIGDLHRDRTVPRRLTFRVGVHAGDVLIRGEALVGDTVNVAARLESAATPGRILVSREVMAHLAPDLAERFRFRGHQALKDLPHPVATYEGGGTLSRDGGTVRRDSRMRSAAVRVAACVAALLVLAYLFAVYDGVALLTAGIGYRLAPTGFVLPREPPAGSLTPGQAVLVDDGTCPSGRIRWMSGGNMTLHLPRGDRCVPRP